MDRQKGRYINCCPKKGGMSHGYKPRVSKYEVQTHSKDGKNKNFSC